MAVSSIPSNLPSSIKAVLQLDANSSDLTLKQIPFPAVLGDDEVLIKVAAACPCAGELTWAKNYSSLVPEGKVPVVCQDLSGTVVAAPEDSPFQAGDQVYARIPFGRPGAAAEYTVAGVSELALKPRALDFLEAAATPLSALTAWQALFAQGQLDAAGLKGDAAARERNGRLRVLVTGAAGGVGSWGVQLAALAGAGAVVAVCGPGKEEAVRALGATEVVNYRETTVAAWAEAEAGARECDLVFDCVGGEMTAQCWRAIKAGGVFLSITADPNAAKPAGYAKDVAKSTWFLVEPLGSNLAEISELIDAGKLRPTVDSVWEFEQYEKAFERVESGHAKGKVIIKVGVDL